MADRGRQEDTVLAAFDNAQMGVSRSTLSRWMQRNHDALLARIGDGPVDWRKLAALFADAKLTDRTGKPPSPETARKAWLRTRQAVALATAKRRNMAAREIAPGVQTVQSDDPLTKPGATPLRSVVIETDLSEPETPRFRLATLRGMSSSESALAPLDQTAAAQPQVAPERQSVDDVLAEFLGKTTPVGFRPTIKQGDE